MWENLRNHLPVLLVKYKLKWS